MKTLILFLFLSSLATRAEEINPTSPAPTQATLVDQDNKSILQRLYPFYAAYGNNEIKMQLSFKVPVVRRWPLYLGYTQQMFYVFGHHTKSFRDLTYSPEMFYTWNMADPNQLLRSIDLGFFSHDSNGKPDPFHRSYNREYVRFNFEQQDGRWLKRFSLQPQMLYSFETTNQDIQNYIGPLAMSLQVIQQVDGWIDKVEWELLACPGGKFAQDWDHGGYQASLSFRLGGVNLVPAFYLQYYRGYAETLLNYNQFVNAFRVGVLF